MIASLRGRLAVLGEEGIVIDVGGVGYAVAVSGRTLGQMPPVGEDIALLIETQMSESDIRLYGFRDGEERDLFRILQSVQGVAARVALALLAVQPPGDLRLAIAAGDVGVLTAAKGVGPKLGRRIVSELKDKVGGIALGGAPDAAPGSPGAHSTERDAVSALLNLGYRPMEANTAVATASRDLGNEAEVQDLVRQSLKELAR